MIDELYTDIKALKEPSRLMDCRLHEVITGQIDVQTDREACGERMGWSRAIAREHGDMLVELGSERCRIRVPTYTWRLHNAIKLIPGHLSFAISFVPKGHVLFDSIPSMMQWAAFIRDERFDPIETAHHDSRPAFAVCELAVAWARRK